MNKQYPKLWNRIVEYYTLVATETFMLPENEVESFVEKSTRNRYRDACNLIKRGTHTMEEVEQLFPLPSDEQKEEML